MDITRPFPAVGTRVKRDYGPKNINTWRNAGEVKAIIDDQVMVVKLWSARRQSHDYLIVDILQWQDEHYKVIK